MMLRLMIWLHVYCSGYPYCKRCGRPAVHD